MTAAASAQTLFPSAYVITGSMSSGKTSVLNELGKRGYATFPEVAREIIQNRKQRGLPYPFLPDERGLTLNQEIHDTIIARESSLPNIQTMRFHDRGLLDPCTYAKLYDETIVRHPEAQYHARYGGVFILDPLPFEEDGLRPASEKALQIRLHSLLSDVYREFGYDPVPVPAFPCERESSIKARADFILAAAAGRPGVS
jgi:predicted ATPase